MSGLSGDGSTPVSGAGFGDMLALMANPQALQAKYEEFAQRQKAAEAAVALVGPAADIQRLRDEASKAKAAADEILAAAQKKAKTTLDSAEATADRMTTAAQQAAQAMLDDAERTKAAAEEIKKAATDDAASANARHLELDKRDNALAYAATELSKRQGALDAREQAISETVKKLKYVRDQLVAQLSEHSKYLNTV